MSHRISKEYHRLVQDLNNPKPEIRLMGLNELTEFAEDHWEYRDKAINLIQPLLQDPDEVIRMIATDSLRNLKGEVDFLQRKDLKKQYEEIRKKAAKIPKVRVKKKDLDELAKKIYSYEGKSRFFRLVLFLSLFLGVTFTYIPGGIIFAVVMLVVFILVLVYYVSFLRQIKKLEKQLEEISK